MSIVDAINDSWGWNGIDAVEVVAENEFGNLLIKDRTDLGVIAIFITK
jgi:hypothetical protein